MYKKRSLATAENARALSSTSKTTSSTASDNIVAQDSHVVNNKINSDAVSEKNVNQTIDDALKKLTRGEDISINDVKSAADSVCENEADIKSEFSKFTNAELKSKMNIMDRTRYSKKADMINAIYDDMLSETYYAISGKNTLSLNVFGGKSQNEQIKDLIKSELESLTDDRFSKLKEKYLNEYKKRSAEREKIKKGIENPQTLDDYLRKKRTVGLSESENSDFERLYAVTRKERRTADKASMASSKTATADDFLKDSSKFTVEESVHTKTGDKIWVVKPNERLAADEWKTLNNSMKSLGGSYWRGNGGWNFKENPLSKHETEITDVSEKGTDKLNAMADSMQKAIDEKSKDRLTNTAKRAREAASAEAEADKLKMVQATIRNIAKGIEDGSVKLLTDIDSRAQVDTLFSVLTRAKYKRINGIENITYSERLKEQNKPYSEEDIKNAVLPLDSVYSGMIEEFVNGSDGKPGYKMIHARLEKALKSAKGNYVKVTPQLFDDISKVADNLDVLRKDYWNDGVKKLNRLKRMGIENNVELRAYLREFVKNIPDADPEALRTKDIKKRETELANSKIDGFFPTPKNIVEKMLDEADIKKGDTVLEPSAGKGNIADEIRKNHPDNTLDVAEINGSLAQLLKDKGYNIAGNDFLTLNKKYDKIIMNPPFEKMQDADHVMHAYDLLNPGGKIVAIMSEGPFANSQKKAENFRSWLDEVGGVSERLPQNFFKNSERSTGVNTRVVVIDKAENEDHAKKSSGNTDVNRIRTEALTAAERTIKPEIISNAELMDLLSGKFGGDGINGLVSKIISCYNTDKTIGEFENLFTDGGKEIYKVLKNTESGNDDIRFSEGSEHDPFTAPQSAVDKLSNQIDSWLAGEYKSNDIFDFGKTPLVLRRLGAQNLPVVMTQDTMVKITGGKHLISLDTIRSLVQGMTDPIMVFKSATVKNAYVILTELNDNLGRPIVTAMHLNKANNRLRINRIASIYAKDGAKSFVSAQFKSGNVKYIDEIKSQGWSTSRGLQLPKLVQSNPDNNSILYKDDIVNSNYMPNNEIYSNNTKGVNKNEQNERNSILPGNSGRSGYEGTGKQNPRIYEAERKNQARNEIQRRTIAEQLRSNGYTRQVIKANSRFDIIDDAHLTSDMRAIKAQNSKRGTLEMSFHHRNM